MFEYFHYKRTLKKLRKEQLKISKELDQVSSNIKSPEDYAHASWISQKEDEVAKWIENLQTKYYCNICQDLLIPIPDREDEKLYYQFNFDNDEGDIYIFTSIGFYHVRKLIREERKEKREAVGYWVALIIGVIGALTGLVSIINSQ